MFSGYHMDVWRRTRKHFAGGTAQQAANKRKIKRQKAKVKRQKSLRRAAGRIGEKSSRAGRNQNNRQ
jgi:hypothetical protein